MHHTLTAPTLHPNLHLNHSFLTSHSYIQVRELQTQQGRRVKTTFIPLSERPGTAGAAFFRGDVQRYPCVNAPRDNHDISRYPYLPDREGGGRMRLGT